MTTATVTTGAVGNASVLDKSVMLQVEFGRFGNRRTAALDAVEVNADKGMLTLSKRLLQSDEFDAIVSHDRETRRILRNLSLPFPIRDGAVLVPIPMMDQVQVRLSDRKAGREVLVEAFLAVYPAKLQEVAAELRDLYEPTDYPSVEVVRERFSMDWQWLDYAVPGKLKALNLHVFEAEKAKLEAKVTEVTGEILQAMRASALGLLEGLHRAISPADDGKRKVFQKAVLTNLLDFVNTFDVRNIAGDADLAAIMADTRALLDGVDPAMLKKTEDNDAFRNAMAHSLIPIVKSLDGLAKTQVRRIIVADEVEVA